ncbi:hypothetical protein OAQ99_07475, partial [Candidatus Kapabacteria bacterium]|nr:hypothetical protein [Candidatus Kapabacteria bacterium]
MNRILILFLIFIIGCGEKSHYLFVDGQEIKKIGFDKGESLFQNDTFRLKQDDVTLVEGRLNKGKRVGTWYYPNNIIDSITWINYDINEFSIDLPSEFIKQKSLDSNFVALKEKDEIVDGITFISIQQSKTVTDFNTIQSYFIQKTLEDEKIINQIYGFQMDSQQFTIYNVNDPSTETLYLIMIFNKENKFYMVVYEYTVEDKENEDSYLLFFEIIQTLRYKNEFVIPFLGNLKTLKLEGTGVNYPI